MPEPTPDRPETLQERIATIIQEGHIKGEASYDTAEKIQDMLWPSMHHAYMRGKTDGYNEGILSGAESQPREQMGGE